MRYLFPLVATSRLGDTILLASPDEVRVFVRGRRIDDHLSWWGSEYDRDTRTFRTVRRTGEWILRDDAGLPVPPAAFEPVPGANWRKRRFKRRGDFEHRNGPVPHVRPRYRRKSAAARKRHGGRGVAIRTALLHAGDPWSEVE